MIPAVPIPVLALAVVVFPAPLRAATVVVATVTLVPPAPPVIVVVAAALGAGGRTQVDGWVSEWRVRSESGVRGVVWYGKVVKGRACAAVRAHHTSMAVASPSPRPAHSN